MRDLEADIVRKMARAMCEAHGQWEWENNRFGQDVVWSDTHTDLLVRSVLLVLRDPTEEMVAAGIAQARECTDDWTAAGSCVAEHIFPAMIDAALSHGVKTAKSR